MGRWISGFIFPVVAVLLLACGGSDNKNTTAGTEGNRNLGAVDVLGIWGSDELGKFEAMVQPWQSKNGGKVNFTGSRDITALLTSRVQGGNPPDIAIPAETGLFQRFASEGKLKPLSDCPGLEDMVRSQYPDQFIQMGSVNGKLYGFFMKADTKGTIWYNPHVFNDKGMKPLTADAKFDDLVALSQKLKDAGITPWSMGMEAGGSSGWPASDWIQQILLNVAGADVYDGVIKGTIPFTDPKVKDAWTKFGQMVNTPGFVIGGPTAVNATNFQNSTYPPFETPPRAAMVYLGGFASGFIKDQFPKAKAIDDYDFFPFPGGGVTGGANIVYAFNNKESTCSLLASLASSDAQKIWVEKGGFTSVNKNVSLDAYPDAAAKKQAEQLLKAQTFRFDLDDAIGASFQQAEFAAITQFIADPSKLDSILSNLDTSRRQGGGR
jgi:alpha-glucoside transport system substrate-binding protein